MKEFIKLELRENLLLLVGLASAFFLSLPLLVVGSILSPHRVADVLHAGLAFWNLLGIPLIAVILGGAFGSGLWNETAHDAEEGLPLSPRAKVIGSFAAATIQAACSAVTGTSARDWETASIATTKAPSLMSMILSPDGASFPTRARGRCHLSITFGRDHFHDEETLRYSHSPCGAVAFRCARSLET